MRDNYLSDLNIMKKEIHPEYREVLFHDTGVDKYFLIRSALETTETREWEDGTLYEKRLKTIEKNLAKSEELC